MTSDTYPNFSDLNGSEVHGTDFEIEVRDLGSDIAIIAPHGGRIEPGTAEIAQAIAGVRFSFYSFSGKKKAGNRILHITSHRFDEPACLQLVGRARTVVSIHGAAGDGKAFMMGGLDTDLGVRISDALERAGFSSAEPEPHLSAQDAGNICNRGTSGAGVQIELSRGLRDALLANPLMLWDFAGAIRTALV